MKRLQSYLQEAKKHIDMIYEAWDELEDADFANLKRSELFATEIIIFRFTKLQDLLGQKIFRSFLEEIGFLTQGVGFDLLLKELEKEGIVDIDRWGILREFRNSLTHEYPEDEELRVANFQSATKMVEELIAIIRRIEARVSCD